MRLKDRTAIWAGPIDMSLIGLISTLSLLDADTLACSQ